MKALKSKGFKIPEEIDGAKVRREGDHFYDQIAVRVKDKRFKIAGGGMLDLFEDVFRDEDLSLYEKFVPAQDPEKKAAFKAKTPEGRFLKWRTWQMSDHAPLWIEIKTDFTENYLQDVVATPVRP